MAWFAPQKYFQLNHSALSVWFNSAKHSFEIFVPFPIWNWILSMPLFLCFQFCRWHHQKCRRIQKIPASDNGGGCEWTSKKLFSRELLHERELFYSRFIREAFGIQRVNAEWMRLTRWFTGMLYVEAYTIVHQWRFVPILYHFTSSLFRWASECLQCCNSRLKLIQKYFDIRFGLLIAAWDYESTSVSWMIKGSPKSSLIMACRNCGYKIELRAQQNISTRIKNE